MPISREQVELAFRLFLGRPPESEATVTNKMQLADLEALRRVFLGSPEFRQRLEQLDKPQEQPGGTPVILHLHIPKTAGSSFNKILVDSHDGRFILAYHGDGITLFETMPAHQRRRLDLVFGHMDYGLHRKIRDNYLYLFVLREPKARLFSFYKYVQKAEDHPLHARVVAEGLSFGGLLELAAANFGLRWDFDNAQMLRVAGLPFPPPGTEPDYAAEFGRACAHAFSESTEFGLVEAFPAYLERLKQRGIIGETAGEERLNTTGSSDSLDAALETLTPAQQDILHRFTYWDSKLYALCAAFLAARYG